MNELKDKEWEEYWLPKIEAECREYELQKKRDKELVWDFIFWHISVLFLFLVICLVVFCSYMVIKDFQRDVKSINNFNSHIEVPYTYRNID